MLTLAIIAEAAAAIDRVGCERVVIAGQDHHRLAVIAQHLRGAFEQLERLAVIVERIAGQQDDVRLRLPVAAAKTLGKTAKTISVAKAVVGAEMQDPSCGR